MLLYLTETNVSEGLLRDKRAVEVPSCSSMIYCQGNLLDTIQKFRLYPDSKTFVDMVQLNAENVTLANFENLMNLTDNQPVKNDIVNFISENFAIINESDSWTPTDFTESPAFLDRITDSTIRDFAKELVSYWPLLGRKIKDEVRENPTQHSLIPVPQGFIVPGGRFREIYYWDSYWIIKGLLLSEMTETVKGMLENFIFLIKTYGFIPNGSRIYYLNRSQPPLFTLMVGLYIDTTNDLEWLKSNIDYLETELLWWINERSVNITTGGINYQLAHYGPESNTPRPESYWEDVRTCAYFTSEDDKKNCYNALKTGAETGWDFSTRWIFDEQGNTNANLTKIDSKRVIPVDLNAFLCKSFKLLSDFYSKVGNNAKQAIWANYADTWVKNIDALMYNSNDGIWYDYDRVMLRQRNLFFPSNFAPLWADCYDLNSKDEYGEKAAKYFNDKEVNQYLGGVPTSFEDSGEQWDLPNAWPPLQEYVALGLYKTGNQKAVSIAEEVANRWIHANMKGFEHSGAMYEKYDAIEPGQYGGGGEYSVQLGFGWSNGVALSFINQFSSTSGVSKLTLSQVTWLCFLILVCLSLIMY